MQQPTSYSLAPFIRLTHQPTNSPTGFCGSRMASLSHCIRGVHIKSRRKQVLRCEKRRTESFGFFSVPWLRCKSTYHQSCYVQVNPISMFSLLTKGLRGRCLRSLCSSLGCMVGCWLIVSRGLNCCWIAVLWLACCSDRCSLLEVLSCMIEAWRRLVSDVLSNLFLLQKTL